MSAALPDPATEPTITIERAAAVLGIGRRTAYAAAERGELPALRVGRCVRVPTARFLATFGLNGPQQADKSGTAA
jgi:excisionase family DNA binding protein